MKKNKFFKALGVGAVATLGLFTMAGCSLSDDEKADVMEGLENANTYMEETIDLLKEQNRKLNEQNQELNEQNQILRDQNQTSKSDLSESKTTNETLTAYLEELKKQVKALEDSLQAEQDENEILGDNLTESQKTNTTLTAYLEELKEQIAVLESSLETEQSENDILQNYLEELQQENAKITTQEAYNKLMIAKARLETNYNGIRDNIRAIAEITDGEYEQIQTVELCKTENNGYVSNVVLDDDFSGFSSNLCYEDGDNVYEYIVDKDLEGNFVKYTKEVRSDFTTSESSSGLVYLMSPLFLDDLSAENIYSVEILENGNYKISAIIELKIKEEGEDYYYNKQTFLLEYELTSDYKFVFMNISQFVKTESVENGSGQTKISTNSGSMTFEYGVITENYINSLLEEAISKGPKAPEEE